MRERCKLRHHRRHARNATNELTLYRHSLHIIRPIALRNHVRKPCRDKRPKIITCTRKADG